MDKKFIEENNLYLDPDFDVRRSMTGKEFKDYIEKLRHMAEIGTHPRHLFKEVIEKMAEMDDRIMELEKKECASPNT